MCRKEKVKRPTQTRGHGCLTQGMGYDFRYSICASWIDFSPCVGDSNLTQPIPLNLSLGIGICRIYFKLAFWYHETIHTDHFNKFAITHFVINCTKHIDIGLYLVFQFPYNFE